MDDQAIWGAITLVFTMGYGGWIVLRFGDNQNFALRWFDWSYLAAFVALMTCYAQGFYPWPSLILALTAGAAMALALFGYRQYKKAG